MEHPRHVHTRPRAQARHLRAQPRLETDRRGTTGHACQAVTKALCKAADDDDEDDDDDDDDEL